RSPPPSRRPCRPRHGVITITGIGDHLRLEWPITIAGMRTARRLRVEWSGTARSRPSRWDAGIAAVTAGEREFGEELGNPLIKNRAVVAASLVAEGTGKPTFADPGRPAQNQIVVRVDPLTIGELVEQSAVEAAWGLVIDVLDAGLLAQSGIAQPGG